MNRELYLRQLIRRYGVRACVRSLFRVHGFDPEIAYLAVWYVSHTGPPDRNVVMQVVSAFVQPVPLSVDDAEQFLEHYTASRGGAKQERKAA